MAVWQSLRCSFPDIELHGCLFHFSQAIHRKVQEFGLQGHYRKKGDITDIIKMLFSLPLLPHHQITSEFEAIKAKALGHHNVGLHSLFAYVEKTWMKSNVWKVINLSAYQRLVRTNNDTEGYHFRLNKQVEVILLSINYWRYYIKKPNMSI